MVRRAVVGRGLTGAPLSPAERYLGAVRGALIGDALAMPAHWYYDPGELRRVFGTITSYLPPPRIHRGSILWRSSYEPTEPEYDILGSQRRYWGERGVHYHQFLQPGESTLNLKLLLVALHDATQHGDYDRLRFIDAYRAFLLRPDDHHDTYVEECHRGFFLNLRNGLPPGNAAVEEKHIGGMVAVVPLYFCLRALGHDHAHASKQVGEHVSVTHAGARVGEAVTTLLTLAGEIASGTTLRDALRDHLRRQDLPFLRGPIERESEQPADRVLGRRYSTACYLNDAMPATFYLALRFADDPREGLITNTMAGGDNCHRGAVLGALFGATRGSSVFPPEWCDGLIAVPPTQRRR